MKRIATLTLVSLLLLGSAVPAAAQGGSRQDGIRLLTTETAAVTAGRPAWIALNWTAGRGDVTDFSVTVDEPGDVAIEYPATTGDHSSLFRDNMLSDAEIDYTAIEVTVPETFARRTVRLDLSISYVWDGRERTGRRSVTIPVLQHDGDRVSALTEHLGVVEADSAQWVELWYAAPGPSVHDVAVTVDPAGLGGVTYPGQGSSSGLDGDSNLDGGETDVARFMLHTDGMTAGEHTVTVTVAYGGGQLSHDVGVTVGG